MAKSANADESANTDEPTKSDGPTDTDEPSNTDIYLDAESDKLLKTDEDNYRNTYESSSIYEALDLSKSLKYA